MFFAKLVDQRSRDAMVAFLAGHLRYDTMNSWNCSTSYAHNIKVNRLGLNDTQVDRAYEMIETDFWDEIKWRPIDEFTQEFGGRYAIGTNGRSSGYLVLYNSVRELTGHKSHCRSCGQRNFKLVEETFGNKCGRCQAEGEYGRVNYTVMPMSIHSYSGKPIDQGEDFSEWSMGELRNRVKLVQAFDRACDEIRNAFIDLINDCKVVSEIVMVPHQRKVIQRSISA